MEEIFNATGCEMTIHEDGRATVKRPEIGSMIHVSNGMGSVRMIVHSYEGNHIICDNDGVEACVCLTKNGDALIWRDITD